jgi:hypothetical protein
METYVSIIAVGLIIVTDDDKKKHPGITQGYVQISIAPAGIGLVGNEILITNNLCIDDSYPNTETQTYGLAESSLCKNVVVGSNFFINNVPSSEARDIFYQGGSTREAFNTYPEYLAKGHFISSSVSYNPTSEALAAAGYKARAIPAGSSEISELSYINVAGNDKMGTIILNVPTGSIGMEVNKPILKITFTKKYTSDISHINIIPHGTDTKTLVAEPTDVTRDSFSIKLTIKPTSPGKIYVWDYEVIM